MSILTDDRFRETPMQGYRQARAKGGDRSGETAQFFLLCVMCFPFCLAQTVARRAIALIGGGRDAPRRSILKEASESAAICASSSFMGV